MRYAERLRLRMEQEREHKRTERKLRNRIKRLAGRTAYCYLCKKESTYGELFVVGFGRAHPHSKGNRCEPCFDRELAEDESPAFDTHYIGEDIFWRLGR